MGSWNFADIWDMVSDQLPDAPCLIFGDDRRTWSQVERRANAIAQHLIDAGLEHQQSVAQYMYNRNEYLESMYGAFKASFVPVNTNYRYTADELLYLWDNAEAGAVVFQGTFTETIEAIRDRLPRVKSWLWVDDSSGPMPEWARNYETIASVPTERVEPSWGRSGDDIDMMYTGGTTGMPKGVMWRQDDLVAILTAALREPFADDGTIEQRRSLLAGPGRVFLPACPLMHATGNFPSLGALCDGGSVVSLTSSRFDPVELLDTVEREGVTNISLVGDVFSKPILGTLDAEPDRWDLSSLRGIMSSGVMWSQETKDRLMSYMPDVVLLDAFSSSEALGMGNSISGRGETAKTAKFELTPSSIVVSDDLTRKLEPGTEETGRLAVGGRVPVGYFKDPEKTASTFFVLDGVRYSCPGDYATVDDDGKITLLGRGSVCINTGGEKVFPEEVENTLKQHAGVVDAVVVGVPDDKWGEAVVAVIEADGELSEDDLISAARQTLAAYKTPKRVMFVETIGRAANGKADYKRLRDEATDFVAK